MTHNSFSHNQEFLQCLECHQSYPTEKIRYHCDCGGLLTVERPLEMLKNISPRLFEERLSSREDSDISGVWRFREAVLNLHPHEIITHPEGSTHLYRRSVFNQWVGNENFALKHEGENPTGSFKDRGMTVAVSQAKRLGAKVVVCASTGNTSSSLAAYAAQAGLRAIVFLPAGNVASGKMAQAIGYGARCMAVKGSFDAAMKIVQDLAKDESVYLVNSLNPFRLEGQKTIIWEIFQNLSWSVPDWIVVPGGNLGNTSAFGKAIHEAYEAGWITKKPRLATIQAHGANPFYQSFQGRFQSLNPIEPETVATAIRIGNPVNYQKAKRMIESLDGVVTEVTDHEILEAKALIDRQGIGCEPASACSLAGARRLVREGVIQSRESVVGVLTGHILKDPEVITKNREHLYEEITGDLKELKSLILE